MIRFLDANIPVNKNIEISLTYIQGIGRKESIKICKKLGLNSKILFKSLNTQSRRLLANYINFNYVHGFHLKRIKKQNIEMLIKMKSYRGNRHFYGYLVRGQRSKNKKKRRVV